MFNGKFTKILKIIASQGEKCMWNILSICNRLSQHGNEVARL